MKNLLYCGIAILCWMSCNPPAPPKTSFTLDKPFALLAGQTAVFESSADFAITFDKISADSRCPQGVQCITAGKADVVLTLTKGAETKTVTLPFTLPNGTSNVTEFNGYTIRVVGVMPFKLKDKEIKPEEYSVAVNVIETPPPAPKVTPGQTFLLSGGESKLVAGDPEASIRFDTVMNDSRCPEGVKCIWAGKVDVRFSLTQGDSTWQVVLASGDMTQGGKSEGALGPYLLQFQHIDPVKKQGEIIAPAQYKATLLLSK